MIRRLSMCEEALPNKKNPKLKSHHSNPKTFSPLCLFSSFSGKPSLFDNLRISLSSVTVRALSLSLSSNTWRASLSFCVVIVTVFCSLPCQPNVRKLSYSFLCHVFFWWEKFCTNLSDHPLIPFCYIRATYIHTHTHTHTICSHSASQLANRPKLSFCCCSGNRLQLPLKKL